MLVWRLCREKHTATAFDGQGARLYPGRWHLRGTPIVYTSGSLALAALEMLCHFDHADAPDDYVSLSLEIPNSVTIETLKANDLPKDWRDTPPPEAVQTIGTQWVQEASSAVLSIPSVVVPEEMNYLINPAHKDFSLCALLKPAPFTFDARLF